MVSSNSGYLLIEICIRSVLVITFLASERFHPFERIIQPEEWWLYKNPIAEHEVCNTMTLFLLSIFTPIVTIFLVNYCSKKRRHLTPAIIAVTLALCINGNLTNIIKLMVGRPRPDFFFRCFPNGKVPNGQPSTYDLKCTGDEGFIAGGRKSFPSGHSSFAFTGLGFSSIYLAGHFRCFSVKGRGSSWRLILSLVPITFAAMIAISRTSDYRHHWQDVVVGSILGLLVSYVCYRQHYPELSHEESDVPYMRTDPSEMTHSQSSGRLQNVYVKRDI
ncbi:phospholipid phosphatase 5-like [Styela clava]